MSAGTDLTADLGYIRALAQAAIATPSEPGALDIISHHALRLLDALEAVLGNHVKLPGGPSGDGFCPTCMRIWPCQTYKDLSSALSLPVQP